MFISVVVLYDPKTAIVPFSPSEAADMAMEGPNEIEQYHSPQLEGGTGGRLRVCAPP